MDSVFLLRYFRAIGVKFHARKEHVDVLSWFGNSIIWD